MNASASEWQPTAAISSAFLPSVTVEDPSLDRVQPTTPEVAPAGPPQPSLPTVAPEYYPSWSSNVLPPPYIPSDFDYKPSAFSTSVDPGPQYPLLPSAGTAVPSRSGEEPVTSEALQELENTIDWDTEYERLLELTEKQLDLEEAEGPIRGNLRRGGDPSEAEAPAGEAPAGVETWAAMVRKQKPVPNQLATPNRSARSGSGPAVDQTPGRLSSASGLEADETPFTAIPPSAAGEPRGGWAAKRSANDEDYDDASLPPLTKNGNRRWKKLTKGQQAREQAQKIAFESFARALLHATSPFTAPLRARTSASLPHIKVDQRFGKPGEPNSAIAQFVVAPLVTNYRPRHFHDLTPGDLLEYHFDLSLVWQVLESAYSLKIGYGPTWKRFAVPYAYIACANYREEVLKLCPNEVPNSRSEAIYDEDFFKDITDLVLAVEELEWLQRCSMLTAMRKRVNLAPLYDVFDSVFRSLENYQIEIWHMTSVPSTFVLKANRSEVQARSPIYLDGDASLWDQLPEISRDALKSKCCTWKKYSEGEGDMPRAVKPVPPPHVAGDIPVVSMKPLAELEMRERAQEKGSQHEEMMPFALYVPVVLSVICVVAATGLVLLKRPRK